MKDLLKKQTLESFNWANKLIDDVLEEKWFISPEILETNFAWQIGHLTLSQYYYTVVLLNGPDKEIAEKIDMKKYSGLFAKGVKINELSSEVTVSQLKENWEFIQKQTIKFLDYLQENDFNNEIFKLPKPHPFVRTKEDSISWNIKHTMWHCGQMGILKRVVDKSLDFGM